MTMPRLLVTLAVLALTATPVLALSLEDAPAPLPGMRAPPPGVTSWDVLGKSSVLYGEVDGAAPVTIIVPPEVEALDGREVQLMGFMFPIEAETPMRRFLLVEYPADCPFCLAGAVEPSRLVEVHTPGGADYREDQVIVSGRLEIVRGDEDGLVYRLEEARLSP
jgi:hypothetical protein